MPKLEDFYTQKFASAEGTLLVIEVSDTTFRYDRNVKVPLYARYGIPEVWIVNVESGQLHFFRSLRDGVYVDNAVTSAPGVTPIPGLTSVSVDLTGLLDL